MSKIKSAYNFEKRFPTLADANELLTDKETSNGLRVFIYDENLWYFWDDRTKTLEIETEIPESGGSVFADDVFRITDNSDATKILAFELAGITTGTTRTIIVPDASDTMAVLGTAQTYTAVPTFSAGIVTGNISLDAGANRTITVAALTGTNIIGKNLSLVPGRGTGNAVSSMVEIGGYLKSGSSGVTAQTAHSVAWFGHALTGTQHPVLWLNTVAGITPSDTNYVLRQVGTSGLSLNSILGITNFCFGSSLTPFIFSPASFIATLSSAAPTAGTKIDFTFNNTITGEGVQLMMGSDTNQIILQCSGITDSGYISLSESLITIETPELLLYGTSIGFFGSAAAGPQSGNPVKTAGGTYDSDTQEMIQACYDALRLFNFLID